MKVRNDTRYPTRRIRTILCAVHAATSPRHPAWKRVEVRLAYGRDGDRSYTGHASVCRGRGGIYTGTEAHLSVPRGGLDVARFAALWRHELLHLLGFEHADMSSSQMWCVVDWWVRAVVERVGLYALEEDPEPERPAPPSLEERDAAEVARLIERRKGWVTKARRAETALKKIDRRLRALSRRVDVPDLEPVRRAARPKRRRR